jgi:hypothetical protein
MSEPKVNRLRSLFPNTTDFDYPQPLFNEHDRALRSTTTKNSFRVFCSSENKSANADTNGLSGDQSAPIAIETSPRAADEGLSNTHYNLATPWNQGVGLTHLGAGNRDGWTPYG